MTIKRLLFLCVLFVGLYSYGQNPTNYLLRQTRERIISSMVDSMFRIPRYNGTPSGVRVGETSAIDGAIAMDTTNHRMYIFSGNAWVRLAKFSELTGGSIYVDSIWRTPGIDSFYWLKNGVTYAIKDSSGGGGSTYYNSNIGSGYRLAVPNTNNIKTLFGNYPLSMDSSTNANALTMFLDTASGKWRSEGYYDTKYLTSIPTWQQTLTAGSTLTGANTIAGGAYNFTFGNMGLFTISQTAKASVSGSNGTAHVSPLTITGGNGGATSYSTGTVSGGNAGNVSVTAGNGGAITGTPSTGIGGSGGYIDLIAGDGGLGTTVGGTAGFVNIQGGTSGGGTSAGSAGYVSIKGGMAASTGNGYGGDIYLSPGAKNGSGLDGHIFLGLSPSLAVRGSATIGSATRGDSLFNIKDGGLYADRGVRFPNTPSFADTTNYKPVVMNSSGTLYKATYWPVGSGGGTPAGNYGNLQINRNGSFATPATDSLNYSSASGLVVKNKIRGSAAVGGDSIITHTGFYSYNSAENAYAKLSYNGGSVMDFGGIGGLRVDYYGSSHLFRALVAIGNPGLSLGTGNTPLAVYATSGQTADIFQIMDNSGNKKLHVTSSGNTIVSNRFQKSKGANVASAGDLTLGADGNLFHITGTTTINAITTSNWQAGSEITLIFDGSVTVKNNTAGGGSTAVMLLSGGADFSATANDVLRLVYDGTSWFEVSRSVN